MAISGWTNYGDDTRYQLDTEYVYEGTSSFNCTDLDNYGGVYNDQTANDKPADVAHEFYGYLPDDYDGFMTMFHTDPANPTNTWTLCYFAEDTRNSEMEGRIRRHEGGSYVDSDLVYFEGDPNRWGETTFSDGSSPLDRWVPYRIECFIDNNGDIRCRFQEDADGDGTWTDILKQDLVMPQSGNAPDGGAVAVGGNSSISNGNDMHIDATEIYY